MYKQQASFYENIFIFLRCCSFSKRYLIQKYILQTFYYQYFFFIKILKIKTLPTKLFLEQETSKLQKNFSKK